MRNFIPKDIAVIPENATQVFKGTIFDVYQWPQKMYDGSIKTFEKLKRPDTVKVIAVKDDKIVVLEQSQPDTELFYDVPGGRHDVEGESELDAAKREMREETGMTFKNWKLVQTAVPHRKIDWVIYTFLADGFVDQIEQKLDLGEKITVSLKTLPEIKDLSKDPKARNLPELFNKVNSIEELLAIPELH